LQRHGISRLPQDEGNGPPKRKFKTYPIGYFHIDIAGPIRKASVTSTSYKESSAAWTARGGDRAPSRDEPAGGPSASAPSCCSMLTAARAAPSATAGGRGRSLPLDRQGVGDLDPVAAGGRGKLVEAPSRAEAALAAICGLGPQYPRANGDDAPHQSEPQMRRLMRQS
jgi:hypothetical protein